MNMNNHQIKYIILNQQSKPDIGAWKIILVIGMKLIYLHLMTVQVFWLGHLLFIMINIIMFWLKRIVTTSEGVP